VAQSATQKTINMRKIRCRLSFHFYKNENLEVFAIAVRDGIYGNVAVFMTPPLTVVQLQVLIDNFMNAYGAYKVGGIAQKGPYQIAKEALMDALDTLAAYVDGIADGDENTILLAGFVPTKGNISQANPPTQPQLVTITRAVPGTFVTECAVVEGADSYGGLLTAELLPPGTGINANGQIVSNDNGVAGPAAPATTPGTVRFIADFNKGRKKIFSGLQIGSTYYMYYWAVNAAGVSILSEPVSKKVLEA
jgi:hypothetical protein